MARRPHAAMKIRLPSELYGKVKTLAASNNRSINSEVLALMSHGMQSQSLEMVVAQALNRMLPVQSQRGSL